MRAKQVDVALNKTCKIMTGFIRATSTDEHHCLTGIAPPNVKRQVAAHVETEKMEKNESHRLYGHQPHRSLKIKEKLATQYGTSVFPRQKYHNSAYCKKG